MEIRMLMEHVEECSNLYTLAYHTTRLIIDWVTQSLDYLYHFLQITWTYKLSISHNDLYL